MTIRTILVEPQHLFLQGACGVLELAKDIKVVGTGRTGQDALSLVRRHQPDVAVIPMLTSDITGIQVLGMIKSQTMVLIVTTEDDYELIFQAIMLGARGYLLKADLADLAISVRRVAAGEIVMDARSLEGLVGAVKLHLSENVGNTAVKDVSLTQRETEVLSLLARGYTPIKAAQKLCVSSSTIHTHCRNVYHKLGVTNQTAAVHEARRRRLLV